MYMERGEYISGFSVKIEKSYIPDQKIKIKKKYMYYRNCTLPFTVIHFKIAYYIFTYMYNLNSHKAN